MQKNRYERFGLDLRVIAAALVAALVIGVINNLRVADEQRVPWSGEGIVSGSDAKNNVGETDSGKTDKDEDETDAEDDMDESEDDG